MSQSSMTTTSITSIKVRVTVMVERVCRPLLSTTLGLLIATEGVLLAIGLTIVVQIAFSPAVATMPGAMVLALVAVVSGAATAWVLGQVIPYTLPSWSKLTPTGLPMIFVYIVPTSLFQPFL